MVGLDPAKLGLNLLKIWFESAEGIVRKKRQISNMNNRLYFSALVLTMVFSTVVSQGVNPLFIPDTLTGPTYNLTVKPGKVQFLAGDSTETYGINEEYLGPTLIMNRGDMVQMHVTNLLPDTTTMHWHGMHVAPEDDGGPHTKILPNATWSPDFEVMDEATTFWYHPHLHEKTAFQVYRGAAGMLIIRDSLEAALNLPRTYGVDDFPLILQDKSFDATNQFIYQELNDTMMINGTLSPYLEVPAQMVRFRILNASNQRVYNVGFPPAIQVVQIGSDGGLLREPVPINRVLLAPGERAEIIVDFNIPQPGNINMAANNSEMGDGISGAPIGPGGGPGNPLDGVDFNLIEFRIGPQTANPITSIPANLNSWTPLDPNDADVIRTKIFDTIPPASFPYLINSTPFDHHYVNDTVILGNTEIWNLVNRTTVAHPFHIHDVQFFVLSINGNPPPPTLAGRKDVIMSLPGDSISFIAKFEDHFDPIIPYMYHCHNLFHEDGGMMGQFLVLEPATGVEDAFVDDEFSSRFQLHPNPAADRITLTSEDLSGERLSHVTVRDIFGKEMYQLAVAPSAKEVEMEVSGLTPGFYLLELQSKDGRQGILKFIRE